MITEDYVSFETAKLLKKKGFDGECDLFGRTDEPELIIREAAKIAYNQGIDDECVIIPTLQMAMKWLREVHKINIEVCLGFDADSELGYFYNPVISDLKNMALAIETPEFDETEFTVYEEAAEAGIKYCLEKLI